jgi:hypothetical protein
MEPTVFRRPVLFLALTVTLSSLFLVDRAESLVIGLTPGSYDITVTPFAFPQFVSSGVMTVDAVRVTAFHLAISNTTLDFSCGPPADTCIVQSQPLGMDVVVHNDPGGFGIFDFPPGGDISLIHFAGAPEEFLQQIRWSPVGTFVGTWSATALTPAVPYPDSIWLLLLGFVAVGIFKRLHGEA